MPYYHLVALTIKCVIEPEKLLFPPNHHLIRKNYFHPSNTLEGFLVGATVATCFSVVPCTVALECFLLPQGYERSHF
ncbi:hypothetical protein [uncultured Nostoc sp.]|uniref:hypothetical protein n=1 Tax=uncultured Nostoc sp. TaxID=340711 RepID=UPI0035CBC69F